MRGTGVWFLEGVGLPDLLSVLKTMELGITQPESESRGKAPRKAFINSVLKLVF
jgi:hypothetical protein